MARRIEIPISTPYNAKGADAAARALTALAKAEQAAAQASSKTAQSQNQASVSAQKLAQAQTQSAIAAQKLAQAEAGTIAAMAKADAAQSKAAQSALRLEQAQAKAASGSRSLADRFGDLQGAAGALGIALGAQQLLAFGKASVDLANTTAQADNALRALAGSPILYADALKVAREQQVLFGGSLAENISGIQGLITVSRDSGIELSKLVDLSQRLAVKDPAQGAAGARIALQEAFSGDPTSLAKRYEIPKAALAALRDESTTASEKLQILDGYLTKIGITSEVAAGSVTKSAQQLNAFAQAMEGAQIKIGNVLASIAGNAAEGTLNLINLAGSGEKANTTLSDLAGAIGQYIAVSSGAPAATLTYGDAIDQATGKMLAWIGIVDGAIAAQSGKIAVDVAGAAAQEKLAGASLVMAGATNSVIQGLIDEAAKKEEAERAAATLASTQERLASLGGAVAGGLMTASAAAATLAAQYGITTAQALMLIDAQARIAGGQARLAGQKRNTVDLVPGGVGASAPGKRGQSDADILATVQKTTDEITAVGVRAQPVRTAAVKAGGGARASAEQSSADKIKQIAEDAAARLVAIDERAAEQRAAAQRKLGETIATNSADLVAQQEANDLELIGASDERVAELQAREDAEAQARIATIDAVKEARAIADAGDAEQAQAVLEQRTQQIQSQQALDEEYAKRRAELAGDPAATEALKTQYDEATAALADATQVRIDLAAQEAQQRAEALAAEKQAVLDNASAQAAALGTTGDAASAATAKVNDLIAAINAIPLAKTVTVNVETKGGGAGSAEAAPSGGGGSGNKAGAGMVGVTSGPATITVGDNPGGVEIVSVTPVSGVGTTSISSGNIRMAGGGTAIAGLSDDDAIRRLEDANRRQIRPTGAAVAGGGTKAAAKAAAAAEKAAKPAIADYAKAAKDNLDLLGETLKIRQAVQDPATWMPINDAVLESAARDADKVARAFATIAATYDGPVLEAAKLYADALGGAYSAIKDGLEVSDLLRGSEALDMGSLARFETDAGAVLATVGRLGAMAATIPEASVSALGNVASTLAVLPSLGMLGGGGGGSNTNVGGVTVNIYPAAGMDARQIASQVTQAIGQSWGARK